MGILHWSIDLYQVHEHFHNKVLAVVLHPEAVEDPDFALLGLIQMIKLE